MGCHKIDRHRTGLAAAYAKVSIVLGVEGLLIGHSLRQVRAGCGHLPALCVASVYFLSCV